MQQYDRIIEVAMVTENSPVENTNRSAHKCHRNKTAMTQRDRNDGAADFQRPALW